MWQTERKYKWYKLYNKVTLYIRLFCYRIYITCIYALFVYIYAIQSIYVY